MTTATIIQRIVQNRSAYEARNAKKNKSEADYYSTSKAYVSEIWEGLWPQSHACFSCMSAVFIEADNVSDTGDDSKFG